MADGHGYWMGHLLTGKFCGQLLQNINSPPGQLVMEGNEYHKVAKSQNFSLEIAHEGVIAGCRLSSSPHTCKPPPAQRKVSTRTYRFVRNFSIRP